MNTTWIKNGRILKAHVESEEFMAALETSAKAKLLARVEDYKTLYEGVALKKHPYQERAVESACAEPTGLWSGEIWTGGGKSLIAAWISEEYIKRGENTIFICPNRTGMGDEADGIINKFHKVFGESSTKLGGLNETSAINNIHFFTPWAFINLRRHSPELFKALLENVGLLIVDEAHHFPEDAHGDLKIYGQIKDIATEFFSDKKVVTLTATHGRMDGKLVLGKAAPDFRITIQEAVDMGYCPEIHGLQVFIDEKCPKAKASGDNYTLNLSKQEMGRYLSKVVGAMVKVFTKDAVPFCAFVRTVAEAEALIQIWNQEAEKRGWQKIARLTGDMCLSERNEVIAAIKAGTLIGYVTCDVGAESIDIPKLEVVHLVRRTKSLTKLMQSVGRTLRLSQGKRRSLLVDYHVMNATIIKAAMGLMDFGMASGTTPTKVKKIVNGGPIVHRGEICFDGVSIEEERALILKNIVTKNAGSVEENKLILLEIAKAGKPRPPQNCALGHGLKYLLDPTNPYHEFKQELMRLAPHWFHAPTGSSKVMKQKLLSAARQGLARPQGLYSQRISNYTCKTSPSYDIDFDQQVRNLAPHWFGHPGLRRKQPFMNQIIELAKSKTARPNTSTDLGRRLKVFLNNHPEFKQELMRLAPHWFLKASVRSKTTRVRVRMDTKLAKEMIIQLAQSGIKKSALPRALKSRLSNFTCRTVSIYDAEFTKDVSNLRPDWFK